MEFSAEARSAFIGASHAALDAGFITEEEFLVRILFLFGEIDTVEPAEAAELVPPDLSDDGVCGHATPRDGLLHFTSNFSPMASWYFRPGDPDPLPSVPHGHLNNRALPKLDPYTGGVWGKGGLISSESRGNIAALWNDNGFRSMALAAIHHALVSNPLARGLIAKRTNNPYKLPGKRRP